ncbi:MAG TPA: phosphoribosyltransferase family protein [Paracoccaceae bacterium]
MLADRIQAGRLLAARLAHLKGPDVVVLALPRGGVPVAAEVATALGAPLDLMLVRKVGLPGHEELALGAIAGPDGAEWVVNPEVAARSGLTAPEIVVLADRQRTELRRRRAAYLGDRPPVPLTGKTVILVDDGIATGATMRAALQALRRARPRRIVLAVPVAPPDTLADLQGETDELICLESPALFVAVGVHYARFPQVSDAEVLALLHRDAPPAPG